MFHAQMSTYTATGDTVKTSIGSLTIPMTANRIVGIVAYATGGAGVTTLENVSGILELESPDLALQPLQLPFEVVVVLTSGIAALQPRVWNVDIDVKQARGAVITGYATMDQALAINPGARWGLIYA